MGVKDKVLEVLNAKPNDDPIFMIILTDYLFGKRLMWSNVKWITISLLSSIATAMGAYALK